MSEDQLAVPEAIVSTDRLGQTWLRSNQWDGPAPVAGDVLDDGTHAWVIRRVSHGAGTGHYTMTVEPVRLFRFRYHDEAVQP